MPFTAQPLCAAYGNLGKTTVTFVVTARTNAAATLTINGVDYAVSFSVIGNDRSSIDTAGVQYAFYAGTVSVTGLTAGTLYSWSVSQSANSDSGTLLTAPENSRSKFAIAFSTCFNPNAGATSETEEILTAWDFLQWYMQNRTEYPVLACLHTDDIYYADGNIQVSIAGMENAEGKTFQTQGNLDGLRPQYDFALQYGIWFGLWSAFKWSPDTVTPYKSAALSSAFQWCRRRMAFMPQWGDHEFQNNTGWLGGPALSNVPNGYHATLNGYDGNGLTVYNQLMAPLQGTFARNRDTNANHWYVDFGGIRYIAMDGTTNSNGGGGGAGLGSPTILYGDNQIDDCLDVANGTFNATGIGKKFFTVIGNPAVAGRGTPNYDAALATFNATYGYNYKDENYVAGEYNRLWLNTGQTPPALMDNSFTNGNMGGCAMVRGDWHGAAWYYFEAPASAGVAAEAIHEIGLCTVNGSSGSTQWLTGGGSADFADDDVRLIGGKSAALSGGTPTTTSLYTVTILEYDGTLQTPEIVIKQYEYESDSTTDESAHYFNNYERITDDNGTVWRCSGYRKLGLYGGNAGVDENETLYQIPQVSSAGIGL